MQRPRDLVRWYVDGFRAEVPDRLNARGGWHDRQGGSRIGSPAPSDAFRSYLEAPEGLQDARRMGDDGAVAEESYRYPMRAALRTLAGDGPADASYPFMAHLLVRIAWLDGDWDRACASLDIVVPVRRVYVRVALERLWQLYAPEPRIARASIVRDNRIRPGSVNPAGRAVTREAQGSRRHVLG